MRINPINFYQRKLEFLPKHFVNTVVKQQSNLEKIEQWVYDNCTGRYCIIDDVYFEYDKTIPVKVIGFENPGDLTLFALSGLAQSR